MHHRIAKSLPFLIALGVIGVVCVLQALTARFSSPAGAITTQTARQQVQQPFYFDLVNRLEWLTYDWRVRQALAHAARSRTVATNLGFVECSDKSVALLADGSLGAVYGLLWPRHLYGRLVRELHAQGARAVGFDIMLGELRPDHGNVSAPDGGSVSSDEYMALESRRAGNVVLAATPGVVPVELFRTNVWSIGDIVSERDADGVLRRARVFRDYRIWHPVLAAWARGENLELEHARIDRQRLIIPPNVDRAARKGEVLDVDAAGTLDLTPVYEALGLKLEPGQSPRVKAFTEQRVWHLGVLLAARELGLDLSRAVVQLERGRIVLPGPPGVERIMPVDHDGFLHIDWTLPLTDRRLTTAEFVGLLAQDMLRQGGETNDLKNAWAGKLVVVGSTATGGNLSDLGATPLEKETPLMTKHWNIANAVISKRFIRHSSFGEEFGLILLLGAVSGLLTWRLRALWASFWVVTLLVLYTAVSVWLFVQWRYWLPLVLPVGGALLMTHVCMVTYRVIFEQAERRRVKSIFSKIVSPNVVNELLGQERLSLGGARRHITTLFADVRGFTQMTDENQKKAEEYVKKNGLKGAEAEAVYDESARETLATVNLYLAAIADNVKKHYGTLDKYIGDCVMAFWGAPTANEKHALACVRAALDSQRAMYELNLQRAEENKRIEQENAARVAAGQPPRPLLALLSLGTGVNTGTVIVGLMGSEAHIFNYTVFGREVNLASRLEGVAGRARIIIGEATYADLQRDDPALAATCVPQLPVTVKGISQAVRVYEVPWRPAAPAVPATASASAATAPAGPAGPPAPMPVAPPPQPSAGAHPA